MSRMIKIDKFSRSAVDIIVPFYGAYQKVARLIESIIFATKSNPYQICLVDDCSPNDQFIELIQKAPQIITFKTPKRLGFAGALKYGFERTEQPWVIFMHSDCVVVDQGWMIEMGRSLLKWQEKKEPVKMVSARTDNPGEGIDRRLKARQKTNSNDVILEEGYLPLFCSMAPRKLFEKIGFLKEYFPCWYEDEEFAFRMKSAGYKQGICGRSWVKHDGGVTINKDKFAHKAMEENRTRCIEDMKLLMSKV